MGDTDGNTAPDQSSTPAPNPNPEAPRDEDLLGEAGKRAIAEERKARKAAEKLAADRETKLREFEERDLSEAQKLERKATDNEARASENESRLLRLEVALSRVIDEETLARVLSGAKRLVGSTREELEADAEELFGAVLPKKDARRPSFDQGIRHAPDPTDDSPKALISAGLASGLNSR